MGLNGTMSENRRIGRGKEVEAISKKANGRNDAWLDAPKKPKHTIIGARITGMTKRTYRIAHLGPLTIEKGLRKLQR